MCSYDVISLYDTGTTRPMTQWGLDALFNPAKRHMDEEKRRLQSTREQIGDSSGGERIDFESGKVTIRRSAVPQTGEDEATQPAAEEAEAEADVDATASADADVTVDADKAERDTEPDAAGETA